MAIDPPTEVRKHQKLGREPQLIIAYLHSTYIYILWFDDLFLSADEFLMRTIMINQLIGGLEMFRDGKWWKVPCTQRNLFTMFISSRIHPLKDCPPVFRWVFFHFLSSQNSAIMESPLPNRHRVPTGPTNLSWHSTFKTEVNQCQNEND